MFIFNIAYRHENGDVEGFTGCAFTSKKAAKTHAIRLIVSKCEAIRRRYDASRLIESSDGLTGEEIKLIQKDFKRG